MKTVVGSKSAMVGMVLAAIALSWVSVLAVEQKGAEDEGVTLNHQDCLYSLKLTNALEGNRTLSISLDRRTSGFAMGFGSCRQFNRMPYDVDASGFKIVSADGSSVSGAVGRLTGEVRVTIHSDGYVPKDVESLSCAYTVTADIVGDKVMGLYKGTFGMSEVSGAVTGELSKRQERVQNARFVLNIWQMGR